MYGFTPRGSFLHSVSIFAVIDFQKFSKMCLSAAPTSSVAFQRKLKLKLESFGRMTQWLSNEPIRDEIAYPFNVMKFLDTT